jgi:hypothetical protein
MTPCRNQQASRREQLDTCLLAGFFMNIFLRPWRWRRYVPPKRRFTLNRLHGVTSQKMMLFITTAVRTSNLTTFIYFHQTTRWYIPEDITLHCYIFCMRLELRLLTIRQGDILCVWDQSPQKNLCAEEEVTGDCNNYEMRSFVIWTLHEILLGSLRQRG